MKHKQPTTIGLLLVLALAGCAQRQAKVRYLDPDKETAAITYPASLRGGYFVQQATGNTKHAFCAEPFPDVALSSLSEIAAKVPDKGELSAKFSIEVVELAGRTQTVLLARELLYRTCELSVNGKLDQQGVKDTFNKVIELVEKLGRSELTKQTTKLASQLGAMEPIEQQRFLKWVDPAGETEHEEKQTNGQDE